MAQFKSIKDLELTIRENALAQILGWARTDFSAGVPLTVQFEPENRVADRNYQRELAREHGKWIIFYNSNRLATYTHHTNTLELLPTESSEARLVSKVLERTFFYYLPNLVTNHVELEPAW